MAAGERRVAQQQVVGGDRRRPVAGAGQRVGEQRIARALGEPRRHLTECGVPLGTAGDHDAPGRQRPVRGAGVGPGVGGAGT